MRIDGTPWRTVWLDGHTVKMIDQPVLPHTFRVAELHTVEETAQSISTMIVRGAGAIGATGALGMAQAALLASDADLATALAAAATRLADTRPTAQNLFAGIQAVLSAAQPELDHPARARDAAVTAALAFADADAAMCERIGEHGSALIEDGMGVQTHCNAGWLAFVDWGSALSPIYKAHRGGKKVHVWVDETRPRSQGARLTAWELGQEGVAHSILADGASGYWMSQGRTQLVIVGADRIAANGDVANKIGTYMVAAAARANGIPFVVAAPSTTIDAETATGAQIPIEERSADEVLWTWGWSDDGVFRRVRTAPKNSGARNPAFDVTPAAWIDWILTERGLVRPRDVLGQSSS